MVLQVGVGYGQQYDSSQESNSLHYAEESLRGSPKQYPSHDQMRVKLPPQSASTSSARPCANTTCGFYGTTEFDFFCSKCYNANLQKQNNKVQERRSPVRSKPEDVNSNNNSVLPDLTRQQHPMSSKVAQGR